MPETPSVSDELGVPTVTDVASTKTHIGGSLAHKEAASVVERVASYAE